MDEMSSTYDGEPSEYASYDNHRPLMQMDYEAKVVKHAFWILVFAGCFVWTLVQAGHWGWGIGVGIFAIAACFGTVMNYRAESVLIFKDGMLVSYVEGFDTKRSWRQLPWGSVLHLDFSDRSFRIATAKDSATHGRVYSYLGKLDRKDKTERVNELKSLQHRGDIPPTLRIVE
ncbi:hypothetical protein ACI2KS_10905 [Pseudomonas sp. NPDC087358]|uniref:hypothetical protein n=1 Tax=Pseudomonas sp. NPDC087358 TaxID=3364439 RepID=UPI00384C7CAA